MFHSCGLNPATMHSCSSNTHLYHHLCLSIWTITVLSDSRWTPLTLHPVPSYHKKSQVTAGIPLHTCPNLSILLNATMTSLTKSYLQSYTPLIIGASTWKVHIGCSKYGLTTKTSYISLPLTPFPANRHGGCSSYPNLISCLCINPA